MPYPLYELPYGLQARLGEIATPAEQFLLQRASGNPQICSTKTQRMYDHGYCAIEKTETTLKVVYEQLKAPDIYFEYTSEDVITRETVFRPLELILQVPDLDCLTPELTPYFEMRPRILGLCDWPYGPDFYQKLPSKMVTRCISHIDFYGKENGNDVFNIDDLCAAFPNIYGLSINDVVLSKTWMTDMLIKQKQKKLWAEFDMSLKGTALRNFREWDIDEFVAFFKAQHSIFALHMEIDSVDDVLLLHAFFKQRFVLSDRENFWFKKQWNEYGVVVVVYHQFRFFYMLTDTTCTSNVAEVVSASENVDNDVEANDNA